MRHQKHRHSLGVKKEHRDALMANLCSALIVHGRIKTTLAKAKALRPFTEKVITLAKKASKVEKAEKLHYYRLALSRLRDEKTTDVLFGEKASDFAKRNGGYTRIYKLGDRRIGDAAEMALIELVPDSDTGYEKRKSQKAKKEVSSQSDSSEKATAVVTEEEPVAVEENAANENEKKGDAESK